MFHILVVDDDTNTRRLLRAVLEEAHYTVSTACDGEEALDVLDKKHVDLVVLDIMMPRMDGYAFTEELPRNASGKKLHAALKARAAGELAEGKLLRP